MSEGTYTYTIHMISTESFSFLVGSVRPFNLSVLSTEYASLSFIDQQNAKRDLNLNEDGGGRDLKILSYMSYYKSPTLSFSLKKSFIHIFIMGKSKISAESITYYPLIKAYYIYRYINIYSILGFSSVFPQNIYLLSENINIYKNYIRILSITA